MTSGVTSRSLLSIRNVPLRPPVENMLRKTRRFGGGLGSQVACEESSRVLVTLEMSWSFHPRILSASARESGRGHPFSVFDHRTKPTTTTQRAYKQNHFPDGSSGLTAILSLLLALRMSVLSCFVYFLCPRMVAPSKFRRCLSGPSPYPFSPRER
jgi:hypothetical protein